MTGGTGLARVVTVLTKAVSTLRQSLTVRSSQPPAPAVSDIERSKNHFISCSFERSARSRLEILPHPIIVSTPLSFQR